MIYIKMERKKLTYEIEKKARVKNPHRISHILSQLFKYIGTSIKIDRYYLLKFKSTRRINFKTDPIIRLRIEKGKSFLTTKKRTFKGKTEINREIEIPLGSPTRAIEFFENALGLKPFVIKKKKTKLFKRGNIKAELNFVEGLGWFLEIEILKKNLSKSDEKQTLSKISSVFKTLGIKEQDFEPRYYIELLLKKHKNLP